MIRVTIAAAPPRNLTVDVPDGERIQVLPGEVLWLGDKEGKPVGVFTTWLYAVKETGPDTEIGYHRRNAAAEAFMDIPKGVSE